jgi:catechol-2,3-dioxygenase
LNKIAVLALWAPDVHSAALFYQHAIGLPRVDVPGHHPHFDLDGTTLVLLPGRPAAAQDAVPERFPLVAFTVPDLEAAIERLRQHQVPLPWGIESQPGTRWIMLHDPAGNLIELVEFE